MRSTEQIRKGNDLMIFIEGVSVAFATNHTLTLTTETEDIQSKDHGYNGAVLPKRVTWEIQSENLYIDAEFEKLFNYVNGQEPVDLVWGLPQKGEDTAIAITADDPIMVTDGWNEPDSEQTVKSYTGQAYITSLVVNAQAGENATYSVTFTGNGDFKQN